MYAGLALGRGHTFIVSNSHGNQYIPFVAYTNGTKLFVFYFVNKYLKIRQYYSMKWDYI